MSKLPRGQNSSPYMSKCNSIPWAEITSISNFNVIHICAIETCVRDWEGLLSWAVLLCNNLCMKSRYHNFILFWIQENIRWRISSNYSYLFVNSENKSKNCYCRSFNERSFVEENMQALINLKFGENISFQVQSLAKRSDWIKTSQKTSPDCTELNEISCMQRQFCHVKCIASMAGKERCAHIPVILYQQVKRYSPSPLFLPPTPLPLQLNSGYQHFALFWNHYYRGTMWALWVTCF